MFQLPPLRNGRGSRKMTVWLGSELELVPIYISKAALQSLIYRKSALTLYSSSCGRYCYKQIFLLKLLYLCPQSFLLSCENRRNITGITSD